jgi:hypothetical protein
MLSPLVEKQEIWKGTIKRQADVSVIDNPSDPLYKENFMKLTLEFIIRDTDSKGRYILNGPNQIILDSNNFIYVQDIKEGHILKFDAKGRFVKTIGRPGMGPGELDGLQNIYISNNEIVASCPYTRRNVYFDLEGRYKRMVSPRVNIDRIRVANNGDIYALYLSKDNNNLEFELVRSDPEFSKFVKIASRKWETFRLFGTQLTFDVTKNSSIVVGNPSGYEFHICDRSGKVSKIIRKEYRRVKIPSADIAYLKSSQKAGIYEIPEYFEPYYRIYTNEDGKILINTHYTISGKKKDMFDVFNDDGQFLSAFTLESYEDCLWRNGRLYIISADAEGLPKISVYKILWNDKT